MEQMEVDDLVIRLEDSLEISSMEHGVKLVGAILFDQPLNKWGVRNIQTPLGRRQGRDLVQLGVMSKKLSVPMWPNNLSLEEIKLEKVSFWLQIRGLPLNLCSEVSARRLAKKIRQFQEMKDLDLAKEFFASEDHELVSRAIPITLEPNPKHVGNLFEGMGYGKDVEHRIFEARESLKLG
ncbi:hypothetical protein COP2_007536 [Malus domestica]